MDNHLDRAVIKSREGLKAQAEALGVNIKCADSLECLKKPRSFGKKTAPNRLVCQAMEGCDGTRDGAPDALTVRRYLRFAAGGAGVIWFEATACLEEGRANPRQLWLREDNADAFKKLLFDIRETAIRENGYAPLVIMQNTHSGRHSKPNGFPAPVVAENRVLFEGDQPLDQSCIATDEHIDEIKEAMIKNARLAEQIGFDGVDIKCCHGYLNSELLSSYNRKNSRYGGSLENRSRLLRETVEGAIQSCSSDFLVSTRMNAYDGYPYPHGFGMDKNGGMDFDPTEAIWILKELSKLGVGLVNITMGNPYYNPHINRPFAKGAYAPAEHPLEGVARILNGIETLHKALPEISFISSGLSYLGSVAPHAAAAYIETDGFDFAGFGRMIFAYPDFAKDILVGGGLDQKKCCIACSKCTELMRGKSTPGCVIKDSYYTELYKKFKQN